VIATHVGFTAAAAGLDRAAAQGIIEAVGLLAAAVVALQIAQTILEEEVIRDSHISAPTRVRRFLSRFLVVLIIALALEGLVAAFKAIHEDVTQRLGTPGRGGRPARELGAVHSLQPVRRGARARGNGSREARGPEAQVSKTARKPMLLAALSGVLALRAATR